MDAEEFASGCDDPDGVADFLDFMITQTRRRVDALHEYWEHDDDMDQITGNEVPLPKWFPKEELYKPLIKEYYEVFKELKQAKENLHDVIDFLRQPPKQSQEDEEQIAMIENLKRKIDEMNTRKQEMLRAHAAQPERRATIEVSQVSLHYEMDAIKADIAQLTNDRDERQTWLQSCMKEYDSVRAQNEMVAKALKKSTVMNNELLEVLKKYQNEAQEFDRASKESQNKRELLIQEMKVLETERVEAEYAVKRLREQLHDHDKMLMAVDLANRRLGKEREIETSTLTKMTEAVSNAEQMRNEAQRLKEQAKAAKDEVASAREAFNESIPGLKEDVTSRVKAAALRYETEIRDEDQKLRQVLAKNAELSVAIVAMERRLAFLKSQKSVFGSVCAKERTALDEFNRGAEAELRMLDSQIEELTREVFCAKEEEQQETKKLAGVEANGERSNAIARAVVDKLEADLAQLRTSISEADVKGKMLAMENGKLNSELAAVREAYGRDVEDQLVHREHQLHQLAKRTEDMKTSHSVEVQQLQQVLMEHKRSAEKWKEAAETRIVESQYSMDSVRSQARRFEQDTASVENEIANQMTEAKILHEEVASRQKEIRDLQDECDHVEHRVSDQKARMDGLYEQQLQFARMKELRQNEIDAKKVEYKRLKREYTTKVQYLGHPNSH